jgi:ElaB/YqjD/DUF883 family membrane-anchored ribosome-binding protein
MEETGRMEETGLLPALDRAERALARIERAVAEGRATAAGRDSALRARVRDAVAELDQLISEGT